MTSSFSFNANTPIVALDVETTGLNPYVHSLYSFALVPENPKVKPLHVYVKLPDDVVWDEWAYKNFERMEPDYEKTYVSPKAAWELVLDFVKSVDKGSFIGQEEVLPLGHNTSFDLMFMHQLAKRAGAPFTGFHYRSLDTFALLHNLYIRQEIGLKELSLSGACRYYHIELTEENRHTALGDAEATMDLYKRIRKF